MSNKSKIIRSWAIWYFFNNNIIEISASHFNIQRIGAQTDEILFLDDNSGACKTAKAAGMKVCGVYDKSSEDYIDDIKGTADFYIRDFSELIK